MNDLHYTTTSTYSTYYVLLILNFEMLLKEKLGQVKVFVIH